MCFSSRPYKQIFHVATARYSLLVLKVLLNIMSSTNQPSFIDRFDVHFSYIQCTDVDGLHIFIYRPLLVTEQVNAWSHFFSLILKWTRIYTTSSPSVLSVCISLKFCSIRVCRVNSNQLSHKAYSIIIYRILYALPAWGGFLSAELANKINALFRRLKDLVTRLATLQSQIW